MLDAVTLRLLTGEAAEMSELQSVLEAAPTYAMRVTGLPVGAADAQSTYSALPEGWSYDAKFVYGVFSGDRMVGCIDVLRGYPQRGTAHIGLFLLAESHQGRGIGRAAYRALEEEIGAWGDCNWIRLGVVESNASVIGFWQRLGFVVTGDVKPYRYAAVDSRVIIFGKAFAGLT